MDIRIEASDEILNRIRKEKALVHWQLIIEVMESGNMSAEEKIMLCERLLEALEGRIPDP